LKEGVFCSKRFFDPPREQVIQGDAQSSREVYEFKISHPPSSGLDFSNSIASDIPSESLTFRRKSWLRKIPFRAQSAYLCANYVSSRFHKGVLD
jgi:hypothetical protein